MSITDRHKDMKKSDGPLNLWERRFPQNITEKCPESQWLDVAKKLKKSLR
jgi:hypothetical protein